ncbi:MAG: hypothetical protein QW076_00330 [Candidatus Anstonellales archaeon]
MFIVHYSDGKTLKEGEVLWDNIPDGISSLQLQTFGNELITLPQCEKYFFSIEAVSQLGIENPTNNSNPIITAKIIGGIIGEKAIMIRADTRGHLTISYLDKKDVPFVERVYRQGIKADIK